MVPAVPQQEPLCKVDATHRSFVTQLARPAASGSPPPWPRAADRRARLESRSGTGHPSRQGCPVPCAPADNGPLRHRCPVGLSRRSVVRNRCLGQAAAGVSSEVQNGQRRAPTWISDRQAGHLAVKGSGLGSVRIRGEGTGQNIAARAGREASCSRRPCPTGPEVAGWTTPVRPLIERLYRRRCGPLSLLVFVDERGGVGMATRESPDDGVAPFPVSSSRQRAAC
jgi:hypothetical protein